MLVEQDRKVNRKKINASPTLGQAGVISLFGGFQPNINGYIFLLLQFEQLFSVYE